jgi:hypothetical protein
MTTYQRSDRRQVRFLLRRFAWRVNLMLSVLVLLLVMLPAQASAAPIGCRYIAHGQICYSSITGQKLIRCDRGYWITAQMTCKAVQP